MNKFISTILLSVMLTSCYVFDTKLTVNNELNAYAFIGGQTEPGNLNEITISAGSYKGKFYSSSATQLNFHTEIDGIKFYIPVHFPSSALDGTGGLFDVTAAQAGQPWSYNGKVVRTYNDSDLIQAVEECGYVVYHEVCRKIPQSDGTYRTVCRDEGHIKQGTQDVEFTERYINEHFKAKTISEQGEEVGQFEGDRDTVKKIYKYKETCS